MGTMAGKASRSTAKTGKSLASQINVTLSPARIRRLLKKNKISERYSSKAMAYLAGALDYLVGEVLEVGSLKAHENKRSTITNPDLYRGIRSDKERFNVVLCGNSFVKGAGFVSDNPVPATKKAVITQNSAEM